MNTVAPSTDRATGPAVKHLRRTLHSLAAGTESPTEAHIAAAIAAYRHGRVHEARRRERPSRRQLAALFALTAAGAR